MEQPMHVRGVSLLKFCPWHLESSIFLTPLLTSMTCEDRQGID